MNFVKPTIRKAIVATFLLCSSAMPASFAYVVNTSDGTVSRIDVVSRTVVDDPLAVGNNPTSIVVDAARKRAYVTNYLENSLSVIDLGRNLILPEKIRIAGSPISATMTPDGRYLYVLQRFGIDRIDLGTLKLAGERIPLSSGYPRWIGVGADGKIAAIVTNQRDLNPAIPDFLGSAPSIVLVDLQENRVVGAAIAIGNDADSGGSAASFSTDGKVIYIVTVGSRSQAGRLFKFSLDERQVAGDAITVGNAVPSVGSMEVTDTPVAVAASAKGDFVYIVKRSRRTGPGSIAVVRIASNSVLANEAPLDRNPTSVAISEDGTLALVASERRGFGELGTVSIIDLRNMTPISPPIEVGRNPQAIAYFSLDSGIRSSTQGTSISTPRPIDRFRQ